jgi:PAS domain S-box-containing protein
MPADESRKRKDEKRSLKCKLADGVPRMAEPVEEGNPSRVAEIGLRRHIAYQDRIISKTNQALTATTRRLHHAEAQLRQFKLARRERRLLDQIQHLFNTHRRLKRELAAQSAINTDLRNKVAQFRAFVQSSVDHIFMLDPTGTFIFSNNQVRRFGLRSGKELVGRRLQDVYSHDVCTLYREHLKTVFAEGRVVTFAHERETENGVAFHQDTLFPIHQSDHIWAAGGVCRDLSDQKQIEKQLFQAQKMEALGTLVAGAAHEINNPINLILFNLPLFEKMWTDLAPLFESLADRHKEQKFGGLKYSFISQNMMRLISDMQMAANRVARIVTGLKQFARKSNPADKSNIQVNNAVENAVRLAASTLSKSTIRLKTILAPNLPLLYANLQNLEQIVLNLMINAVQSISCPNGLVRIKTAFRDPDQAITIEISDNGRGINPAVAEKIFDPFVTDRQSEGGTGLGLSVTYNLVKAHNGEIYFETKAGQGTTFTVVLPTIERQKKHRIMVVDDDASFRALIIQVLSRKTYSEVEGFANGAEALIRLGSSPPDLLILDMFMPEIDGLGVCRAIKNELGLELMKVVIVTGFPDHPNVLAAKQLGFKQILVKPINITYFLKHIHECLNGTSAG